MKKLNQQAAQLAVEFSVRGGTDVTGFSFLGHASEVAQASGVGLQIEFGKVPFVSCASKYAQEYTFPGGASDNRLFFESSVSYEAELEEWEKMLLFDPQTSGGLLLSVPQDQIDGFTQRASELDVPVWQVGRVVAGQGIAVLA